MIKSYLTYKRKASKTSSSPFVQDFITNILSKENDNQTEVETLRKALLKNKTEIEITDFGAGSKKLSNHKRRICDIAKISGTPKKYTQVLSNLTAHYNSKSVLELGTSLGLGTLSLSSKTNDITSIEGDPLIHQFSSNQLSGSNIKFVNAQFDDFIQEDEQKYDLLFIDGNHSYEATMRYADLLMKNSHDKSIFIFDDINWSDGMTKAWKEIVNSDRFSLTIDLFKLGICFRNPENSGNFIIKY